MSPGHPHAQVHGHDSYGVQRVGVAAPAGGSGEGGDAHGAEDSAAQELIDALEACNQARYAGFDPSRAETDYQNAAKAIVNVNKSIKG